MRLRLVLAGAAVVALAVLPFALSSAHTARLATVGAYTIAVLAVGVLARGSGRLSLGHGAFMAAGGLTTALLAEHGRLARRGRARCRRQRGRWPASCSRCRCSGAPAGYYALPTLGAALALAAVLGRYPAVVLPHPPRRGAGVRGSLGARRRSRRSRRRPAAGVRAVPGGRSGRVLGGLRRVGGGLLVLVLGQSAAASFPVRLSLLLVAAAAIGFYGAPWAAPLGALSLVYVPDLLAREHAGRGPRCSCSGWR